MRRMRDRTSRLGLVTAAIALAVTWLGVGGAPNAGGYSQWSVSTKCNVGTGGAGLWRDAPGKGAGMESAFVWARNTGGTNEFCTWYTTVPNIPSDNFRELRITAAVNDGSQLSVTVFNTAGAVIARTSAFSPNSAFQTVSVALPPAHVIGRVEMALSDNPFTAALSGRSSALVDDIKIWNPTSLAVGWSDDFSEGG